MSHMKLHPSSLEEGTAGVTRRGILRWGTFFGALLSALGITRMLQAFLSITSTERKSQRFLLGHWDDFQKIDVLEKNGIYLIRDHASLHALRGECTHLGCRVRWDQRQDRFECPCHGSRYDRNGRILAGPTQTPLQSVFLKLNDQGEILADLSRKSPAGFRLQAG